MDKNLTFILEKAKKNTIVLAVALFGSYARGEPHRDIDICVFLKPGEYTQLEMTELRMSLMPLSEKYDVQIFQQLPLYIRKRILKEGKILYCGDENELYDIYFHTARDYTHFEHIYEGYLEAVAHG